MEPATNFLTFEQRFELLMDAARDYAIFFTDQELKIREWNSGAEKMLGYREDEVLGRNADLIFTPEDRAADAPRHEYTAAARDGQASDERWHLRKDGTRFFAVGRMMALKDEGGEILGFAKILRDVTPNKALQDELQASDQRFRATFAQAPIGMVLSNLEGRIQQVNTAFTKLTGFAERELTERALISLTVEEDRPDVQRQISDLMSGRRSHAVIEKRLRRSDGSSVWVQNSCALLRDPEGRPLSVIDLCLDISAMKMSAAELGRLVEQRTAALADKTEQMEAFCYTVAHDLRAPLRAIAGYAEYLRELSEGLSEEGREFIGRIERSAARLDHLITDLLGYTRVRQVPMAPEEVDLTEMLERIAGHLRRENEKLRPVVTVEAPLGRVRSDRLTLEHVFLNLTSNAVKFRREEQSPIVRIRSEDKGDRIRVWVEDNGIGIDPRFRDRVFGMFERLHPEKNIPGTGVGLAIVATAMDRLGGTYGVEPNEPAGSRFWVELPK